MSQVEAAKAHRESALKQQKLRQFKKDVKMRLSAAALHPETAPNCAPASGTAAADGAPRTILQPQIYVNTGGYLSKSAPGLILS
jgi:hypothetical protein